MTDAVAMLLNLVTLAEGGQANFKLELSRTFYDPEDFTPRKSVKVDGFEVCVVDFDDLTKAAADWECLRHESLERYMPAKERNPHLGGYVGIGKFVV